jgi:phosphatidylserine/phosphatidylglycerophosphate/cardiolipin synthase-like enzyme
MVEMTCGTLPVLLFAITAALALTPRPAVAADVLCDTAFENCRTRLLDLIRNEQAGIDVAFWFMEDARYTAELVKKWQEGVPVRVIVDVRGSHTNPLNAERLAELQAGGIPMRYRTDSNILHWKMMLFDGQNTVQFSAANYSDVAFVPEVPYLDYIDEVIYFTDDQSIVDSFRTKYDTLWVSTKNYGDYANIASAAVARYAPAPKDPELNFPPLESYRNRVIPRLDAEATAIDVIMYRVTDRSYGDALLRAVGRGVPVRLLTEPHQYRDPSRYLHSWNVDRLFAAGVQIRHRAHAGLNHQKSVVLRSQAMTVWGSSNWTAVSTDSQEEHNYFTKKPGFFYYFSDQFERKWFNTTGFSESEPFVPLPPDAPVNVAPAHGASEHPASSVTLTWNAGIWAHVYDIHFGTSPDPPLFSSNVPLGPSTSDTDHKRYAIGGLVPGTTYYWRIVSKTMANMTAEGRIHSFTTAGTPPPPSPNGTTGAGDIVLYAARAETVQGLWRVEADSTAAGGFRIGTPNGGAPKIAPALPAPADYFEMTFTAEAGRAYRLWIRGKAESNYWGNDSAHVQFSDSVDAAGNPIWGIGTTKSTEFTLENGTGAGVAKWGWQDNGYGTLGPLIYFAATGTHLIRVQKREDGLWIDQIVLSPETFLNAPPGGGKNDTTILPDGSETPPSSPPPPSPLQHVLYASNAAIVGTSWEKVADATAAGGWLIRNPDAAGAKINTAIANPPGYFELSFNAEANTPYRLWIRGRAHNNHWANDSVHVQFSDSLDETGVPAYRIGTTGSLWVNLEDCGSCGVAGWGWQDGGYGEGVLGPLVYFAAGGTHTLRVQTREDGFSLDQIVLSAADYLNTSPGALKHDTTILVRP